MASLKTTLNVASTTLFPTPINMTFPVDETIALDASFSSVTIATAAQATIYSSVGPVGTTEVVYLFIQSVSTNTVDATIDINSNTVGRILPGDVLWFPVDASANPTTVQITNNALADSVFNFIYAEKG